MLILLMTRVNLCNTSTTSRINYGIIFEKESQIYFSAEHWTHTYVFKLERPKDLIPIWPACINCTNTDNMLNTNIRYVFSQLNKLHNETIADIDKTIQNIFKLIPSHEFAANRKRRSVLPIIGKISKGLFGLATVDDVQKIANYVNILKQKQNKAIESFSHEVDILHSFMSATDQRNSNLIKGVKENNRVLNKINRDLQVNFDKLQEKNSMVMSILVDQIQKSSKLSKAFSDLMLGIHSLLQNRLTTNLVPYTTLAQTLTNIQSILSVKRPGFHLLFKDPHFYYKHEHVLFYRHNNEIMVTIKFPIGKLHKPMALQKLYSYHVPVHFTSDHATSILDLPPFIAISHSKDYYTEVNNEVLRKCHHYNKVIFCNFNIALLPASHWKCSFALYNDNREQIQNTCNFRFLPNTISPSLTLLNQTHILIYNISTLTLQCSNGIKVQKGCFFCILMLPCNCSIITDQYYVPERWTGCRHKYNDFSKVHPVNLAVLQEYFNADQLKGITSQSTFPSPLNVSIPQFKLYESNVSQVIANDQRAHMNLKGMIELSKKNKMIFASLADSMFSTINGNSDSSSAELILSVVSTVLAFLAFALLLFLFRKYRYISLILAAHRLLPESKAYSALPSFHYTMSTENEVTSTYPTLTLSDISDTSNVYLAIFIIIVCIALIIRRIIKSKVKTVLVLEITDGNRCIQMNVQTLPSNVMSCHFTGTNILTDISLTSGIISSLTVNWGDLKVINALLKNEIPLNTTIAINPCKAFLLKRMLQNNFSIFIWINHNNVSVPIQICKPSCCGCSPENALSTGFFQSDPETAVLK